MARDSIPTLDLREYSEGDATSRENFVQKMGEALEDIGFFALTGHGIPLDDINRAYEVSETVFNIDRIPNALRDCRSGWTTPVVA